MYNILVTGAKGQLGTHIKLLSTSYKHIFFFESSETLDVTNANLFEDFINRNAINVVINCAAYTAVDKAENEPLKALNINTTALESLVKILEKYKVKLIHISTDYVFDGNQTQAYVEEDSVNPLGVYGVTKYKGEQVVINSVIEAVVLRTSWLYGGFGANFLKTMLRLGNIKTSINVVSDQIGTPTYAMCLAKVCLDIITNFDKIDAKGRLYHYSNEGVASWYDFAKAIMEFSDTECSIVPIETKDYITAAKRPKYTVLDKKKIKEDFGVSISDWRVALKECITKMC